jgi:hypothetical protein
LAEDRKGKDRIAGPATVLASLAVLSLLTTAYTVPCRPAGRVALPLLIATGVTFKPLRRTRNWPVAADPECLSVMSLDPGVWVAVRTGKALTGRVGLVDGHEFGLMKGAAREKTWFRVWGVWIEGMNDQTMR